jgi:hypothetical protein
MTKKYALGIIHADSSWRAGNRYNLNWIPDAEHIWDLDQLRADPRPKILMINVFNPGGEMYTHPDYSWVDLIIGVSSELCNYNLSVVQTAVNNQNVIIIAGGAGTALNNPDRIYYPMMYWVSQTFENNSYVPTTLPNQKPYLFDALLGFNKPHRAYIFYRLFEDGLLDQSLVSIWRQNTPSFQNLSKTEADNTFNQYFLRELETKDFATKYGTLDGRVNFYRSPELDQLELPEVAYPIDDPFDYTSMQPTARRSRDQPDKPLYLSQEIPTKIYDASWYSIVAETQYNLDHVFITEKTGKTILAKRVFVLFAPQGCLKFLRSQGFQTFDGIIDESYDSEPNNLKRFDQAWQQVRLLSTLDPREVYDRAHSILEHNYNLLPTLRNEHLAIRDFIAPWLPT